MCEAWLQSQQFEDAHEGAQKTFGSTLTVWKRMKQITQLQHQAEDIDARAVENAEDVIASTKQTKAARRRAQKRADVAKVAAESKGAKVVDDVGQ